MKANTNRFAALNWCWRDSARARVPEDLSLKLRLAISHEAARRRTPHFGSLILHVQNALRAFMVPATTGLVATVLIFGVLIGLLASPPPVHANASDVPLMFATDPELQPSSFGFSMGVASEDSLVIQAYIDANGRVQDYRIIAGAQNPKRHSRIKKHVDPDHFPSRHLDGNATTGYRHPVVFKDQRKG